MATIIINISAKKIDDKDIYAANEIANKCLREYKINKKKKPMHAEGILSPCCSQAVGLVLPFLNGKDKKINIEKIKKSKLMESIGRCPNIVTSGLLIKLYK